MRNLKKILALVLALVMSLSLMATASAADFTDASSINDTYETAVEVLSGLGVFNGYKEDGSFRPQGSITRAETAAIIYRIVTGDVEDKQVGIYADYNIFTDVPSTAWYAGYVNFCANAEYIKGVGGGKFNPQGQVTGYAALAMILRAIGYTANGGFTGPEWEVQTARTAADRKITKNINTGTLGQPATRETVAEILFQAILVNMVDHNVDNTFNGNQGYTEIDMTLGYKTFKLEQIEGIVTGNEYADLDSWQVLDKGETNLQVADEEEPRSLAITTEITDIGESRYAYITGSKVLAMGDTGLNKVTEFGHACDITSTTKFNATAEMPAADDIEYYLNFSRVGTYTCDQRLEFNVVFYGTAAERSFRRYAEEDVAVVAATESGWSVEVCANTAANPMVWAPVALPAGSSDYDDVIAYTGTNAYRFTKIIRANEAITDEDLAILRGIFGAADNEDNNVLPNERITGDVYVGTKSTPTATEEERDLSNTISFTKFFTDYINDITYDINWGTSVNGDWVKFVDNNGDGKADYAFRTWSWLDECIDTYTNKDGDTVLQYNWFDDDDTDVPNGDTAVRYMNDAEIKVGDKVICAQIDNQILVEPAKSETETVTDYNWRDDQIKTSAGNTYGQSGIGNATELQQFISTMADGTKYIVYLDHFGYVRAYELPGGTQYALVTEIYARNNANGNLVQNWPMNVELVIKDADPNEYNLVGGVNNLFSVKNTSDPWTLIDNLSSQGNYYNFLRPATAHMGVETNGFAPTYASAVSFGTGVNATYRFWTRSRQLVKTIDSMTANDTFEYGSYVWDDDAYYLDPANGISAKTVSFTNVAVTNIDGENATLTGAAQLRRDRFGNILARPDADVNGDGIWQAGDTARYAVDYVELTKDNVAAGQTVYPISDDYVGWQGANNNNYVSATHNTEYYIVYNRNVYYFTDYVNMPALTMADNNIHAAYAVAHDTSADDADQPYWVADVIVYEVQSWDDSARTSIALAYYNPSRNDQQVQLFNALDSKNDPTMVNVIPDPLTWSADANRSQTFGPDYAGYAFYHLWDGEKQDNGDLAVSDIEWIDGVDHRGHSATTVHADGNCGSRAGWDLRWNSNLIFAGVVVDEVEVGPFGTYLNVATYDNSPLNPGTYTRTLSLLINNSSESNVYSITTDRELGSRWDYNEAGQLRYNNVRSSQIKAGDRIVWVAKAAVAANGTQSAAFVVDMGNDTTTGANANSVLRDNTAGFLVTYNALGQALPNGAANAGLWNQIMNEQIPAVAGTTDVEFNLVLGVGETAKISVNTGDSKTIPATVGGNAPGGTNVKLKVPNSEISVTLTIELSNIDGVTPVSLAAVVANAPWTASQTVMTKNTTAAKTYTVTLGKGANVPFAAYAVGDFVEAKAAEVRIYTDTGATALATFANGITDIGTGDNELTYAEASALKAILTDLEDALPSGTLKSSVTAAKGVIDGLVSGVESTLTSELTTKQTNAKGAADAAAAGYTEDTDVAAALDALKTAIDNCTIDGEGDSDIATYWDGTDLVADQTLVKALTDAVAAAEEAAAADTDSLPNQKKAALAAVDTLVGTYGSVTAVANAKKALVDAINACTSVAADPSVPTALVLNTYWADDNGTMKLDVTTAGSLGKALKDAVDAAASAATAANDLKQAQTNAKYALNELTKDYDDVQAVATAKAALVTLIDACEVGGSGAKDIATYFASGALKTAQTEVKAVVDAVAAAELAANKVTAKAAVDALFTDAGVAIPGTSDSGALKTAYDAVIEKIDACAVDGTGPTLLSTYWTADGLKDDQTQIAALITEIEAAAAN